MRFTTTTAAVAAVLLAACNTNGADDSASAMAQAKLDSTRIAELRAEYPRLGPDPLPQPTPSEDAAPHANIPGLPQQVLETITGEATFYAQKFEGRRTASGIPFRQNQMVAAHRGYPFGTLLRVTNLANDQAVNVRVVDRGPFGSSARARRTVLDLSRRAAERLGYTQQGRASVKVEVLEWGRGIGA